MKFACKTDAQTSKAEIDKLFSLFAIKSNSSHTLTLTIPLKLLKKFGKIDNG